MSTGAWRRRRSALAGGGVDLVLRAHDDRTVDRSVLKEVVDEPICARGPVLNRLLSLRVVRVRHAATPAAEAATRRFANFCRE